MKLKKPKEYDASESAEAAQALTDAINEVIAEDDAAVIRAMITRFGRRRQVIADMERLRATRSEIIEECARVAEDCASEGWGDVIAVAIRALKNKS